VGDEMKIDPYDIMRILYRASAKKVTLSMIARELGVRKQSVHKHMDKLVKSGFVTKDEKGHYILTENGRRYVEYLSSMEKKLDDILKKFHELWSIGKYNFLKNEKLRKGALYLVVAGALGYFLVNIAKISRRINKRVRDKDLDRFLGSREFREEILDTLLDILLIGGEDSWRTLETFLNYIIAIMFFNMTIIALSEKDEVHKSRKEIYKNNSHMS